MKNILCKIILGIALTLVGCQQKPAKENALPKQDSVTKTKQKGKELIVKTINKDSLQFKEIEVKMLAIARQHIGKDHFFIQPKPFSNYELGMVTPVLKMGHLFSKKQQHLLIRTSTSGVVYFNVYLVKNQQFKPVLQHETPSLTFVNDTLQDVNGDGQKDLLVNWYAAAGCCLKGFTNVFLYQPKRGTLADSLEFINPTFSAKEKVIRGITYGQPGFSEMYKFRWHGNGVDTIEYIYYEIDKKGNKTGKVIQSRYREFEKQRGKITKYNEVPKEYRTINDYDWFTGAI